MSDTVYSARGLLEQFSETVWFPLVLGMKHIVKELIPLTSQLQKDALVSFTTPRRKFDRIIRDYEHAMMKELDCLCSSWQANYMAKLL